jgi:stage V sporulation protein AA
MSNEYLYIKVDKNSMVKNRVVYLEDVAKLYSTDTDLVNVLKKQVILTIKDEKASKHVFSLLKVIEIIQSIYSEVQVINLGEIDFIIQYQPPKKEIKILKYLKIIMVSLIIFFGSAFAIMTFNADVSVHEVFNKIYELIMGSEKEGGTILEISYSIGIPIGIIVFYNHFSKARLSNDPTPLKVQMRVYEEELDKTLIANANREDKIIDVD